MLNRRGVFVGLMLVLLVGVPACGAIDDDQNVPAEASDVATPTVEPTEPAEPTATSTPVGTTALPQTPSPTASPTPTTGEPLETSTPIPTETEVREPTATPTAEPVEPTATEPLATFTEEVDALLAEREGIYSVVVSSQYEEIAYQHDSEHLMEAASLYKLPVMVEIFRQREAGVLDFADTVYMHEAFFNEAEGDIYDESFIGTEIVIDELVYNMVTLSSNVAAYALLELAGTGNINATMIDLGLTSTEIRWSPIAGAEPSEPMAGYAWSQETDEAALAERADEAFNVTTASDMSLLFQLLLEGSVVNPEASAEMLDLLEQQHVNYLLPAGVPEGVAVAHKTGTLPGLIHDCGVIYTASGPVVVAVLIESDYEGEAVGFIQQLAGLANTFAEQHSSS